jgi:peptide deformylase
MLDIVKYPDPVLTRVCRSVTTFGAALNAFVEQMTETMYTFHGVGLAAPQVGITECIAIIDPSAGDATNQLQVLINPRVTWRSPEVEMLEEGCLSLPGVHLKVMRPRAIDVEYFDLTGAAKNSRFVGLASKIVQHEVDHLGGTTVLDRAPPLARALALKLLRVNG